MAVLLRFLEPLIYPPPWSIINANSTENDVLSPFFLPCNEKIPHCNFFSKRHTNYLFFVHITNSQTFRFSIYRDFPRYCFSRAVFKYSPLWREKKKRSKETKEGRKTKGERSCVDKGIYTRKRFFFLPPLFFSSPSFGCFSIDNRRTGQRGNAVRFSDSWRGG